MPFAEINGTALFYVQAGQGLPRLVMHGGRGFNLHLPPSMAGPLIYYYYDHLLL